MTKRWLLALLLGCITPAYAETQPAALPSQSHGAIVIQFQPPVGKQLHYQVTTSGKAVIQQISLRFERSGDGYLMHSANKLPDERTSGVIEAALAQPVTFTVDTEGKVTGIVDEDAYWRRVGASLQPSKASSDARAPASKFFESVRAMSSDQRAAVASSEYGAILRGIGTHRSIKSNGAGIVPLNMDVLQSPDTVTIVAKTDVGPDNMAEFVDFLRSSGAPYDGPARPNARSESTYKIVVDRMTGLLLHSELAESRFIAGKVIRSTTTTKFLPDKK